MNQREPMKRLLERSSLGIGARSLRARTDPAAVRRIMERARAPRTVSCDPSDGHDRRDCLVEFLLEGDASIMPLTITCDSSRPTPHGHNCRDCLVEFFFGDTKAEVTRLGFEADRSSVTIMEPDLRAALDTLEAAGLEPRVRSNHRSAPPIAKARPADRANVGSSVRDLRCGGTKNGQ